MLQSVTFETICFFLLHPTRVRRPFKDGETLAAFFNCVFLKLLQEELRSTLHSFRRGTFAPTSKHHSGSRRRSHIPWGPKKSCIADPTYSMHTVYLCLQLGIGAKCEMVIEKALHQYFEPNLALFMPGYMAGTKIITRPDLKRELRYAVLYYIMYHGS